MIEDLIITPINPVNLDTLVDAYVQAKPFDDPAFKDKTYLGVISEVKLNRMGTFVHFRTPDLVAEKWIPLRKVVGFAHYEMAKATA